MCKNKIFIILTTDNPYSFTKPLTFNPHIQLHPPKLTYNNHLNLTKLIHFFNSFLSVQIILMRKNGCDELKNIFFLKSNEIMNE
jgi:hypothetical protein